MNEPNKPPTVPSVHAIVLLPCPFCGSENVYLSEDGYGFARWVACDVCGTTGPVLAVQPGTKDAAVSIAARKWNRRDGDLCRQGCKRAFKEMGRPTSTGIGIDSPWNFGQ